MVFPKSLCDKILEDKVFEFCATSYNICNYKFVVVGLYRSPSSSCEIFVNRLDILIDYLNKRFDSVIIGGDLNIDVLKHDRDYRSFTEVLISNDMGYLVDFPTRVANNSETAIDNFLAKNKAL